LTVFFHKVPVYKEEDDLCDRTNCPAQGNFEVLAKQKLPSFTLPVRKDTAVFVSLLIGHDLLTTRVLFRMDVVRSPGRLPIKNIRGRS